MTPEERQAAIEATATERAATLNPPVHRVTVAELHKRLDEIEGKPTRGDYANDMHQKQNALEDQHGKSRATFIQKLVANNLLEEGNLPLFLRYLNEYEVDGSGDPPYDVAELAANAKAQNEIPLDGGASYNMFWDTGYAQDGDPYGIGKEYLTQSPNPNSAFAVPSQEDADKIQFPNGRPVNPQTEFEQVAYEQNGVDVRPSEEKTNG